MPRFTSNPALRPEAVADPSADAAAFHVRIPGWRETPVRQLDGVARELGLAGVALKDESDRLGLPAFKVLGASWAVERALREAPDTRTLVAASAGNHGRAVAHVAAMRGLACRIFVPARAAADRRAAIEGEGAEVVVVDGTYEDAVRLPRRPPRSRGRSRSRTSATPGPPTGSSTATTRCSPRPPRRRASTRCSCRRGSDRSPPPRPATARSRARP